MVAGVHQAQHVVVGELQDRTLTVAEREDLYHWVDGDGSTAWDPDLDEEVRRRATIYIDLGATFRVDRIRFYPRLDNEHRGLVLGNFEIGSNDGQQGPILNSPYRAIPGRVYSAFSPNRKPVVDVYFPRRDVRYIRLNSSTGEPWELAEFEV